MAINVKRKIFRSTHFGSWLRTRLIVKFWQQSLPRFTQNYQQKQKVSFFRSINQSISQSINQSINVRYVCLILWCRKCPWKMWILKYSLLVFFFFFFQFCWSSHHFSSWLIAISMEICVCLCVCFDILRLFLWPSKLSRSAGLDSNEHRQANTQEITWSGWQVITPTWTHTQTLIILSNFVHMYVFWLVILIDFNCKQVKLSQRRSL